MPDENMSFESIGPHTSPFDAIRHVEGDREFWLAREPLIPTKRERGCKGGSRHGIIRTKAKKSYQKRSIP